MDLTDEQIQKLQTSVRNVRDVIGANKTYTDTLNAAAELLGDGNPLKVQLQQSVITRTAAMNQISEALDDET